MIILLFSLFIVTINQTIVSIAGPSILADLGGFKYYSWIFSGAALTAAICSPITGKLYELYGAKKIIISFLLIFTVAILFCGLSNSMFSLIVFRTMQGVGIGGVYGIIWIMTASLWNPDERGKWVGIATASFTAGTMIGPIMGGYISEIIGWRWIFFFNLPLSLFLMIAIFIVFPSHEKTISRKFDYKGTIVFIFFVSSFLIGISNIVQDNSYIYMNSIILFLISFGSLGLFIYIEKKEKENALIDLSLFKYKFFIGGSLGSVFLVSAFVTWSVFLPLSLVTVYGYSLSKASIPLMTYAIGIALGSSFFGFFISQEKLQLPISLIGFILTAIAFLISGYTYLDISFNLLLIIAFVVGFGFSGTITAYIVPIQNKLPENKIGIVTTWLQFSRIFGNSFGTAILGVILLLNMTTYNFEPPREYIYNPDNISSIEKIEEIKAKYVASGKIELFNKDLQSSKENLNNGLRYVYFSSSIAAVFGIIISILMFPKFELLRILIRKKS